MRRATTIVAPSPRPNRRRASARSNETRRNESGAKLAEAAEAAIATTTELRQPRGRSLSARIPRKSLSSAQREGAKVCIICATRQSALPPFTLKSSSDCHLAVRLTAGCRSLVSRRNYPYPWSRSASETDQNWAQDGQDTTKRFALANFLRPERAKTGQDQS